MTTLRTIVPAMLVLLGLSVAAQAPEAQDADEPRQFQYLLYYLGNRVGWAKSEVRTIEQEGREVLHEKESGYIEIRRSHDGQSFKTHYEAEYWYGPDGRTIRKTDTTTNGGQTVKAEVIYSDEEVTVNETVDGGAATTTTLDISERRFMCNFSAWRHLRDNDLLKAGKSIDFWDVDAAEHTLVEQKWTVTGPARHRLDDGQVAEGTEIQIISSGRASTVIVGDDDWPLRIESAGGFTQERVKEIPYPFQAERVTLRNAIKANVNVEEFRRLESMDLHFEYEHDDGDGIPQIADTNSYHTVVKYDGGYALRLKAQRLDDDFECAYPLEDIPEDIRPYLDPTPMCQSDDEDLAAEARKLSKRKTRARGVAQSIMRWTARRLKGGSGTTGSASAKQAYNERQGDCTEHSVLFVAVCRAAGLPARCASGMVYAVLNTGPVVGYHQWAEVWLGEWVPVDPTVNELGTSARYILFEYDEPGHTHGRGRSSRCLKQDIEPVIDAYALKDGTTWRRKDAPEFDFDQTPPGD